MHLRISTRQLGDTTVVDVDGRIVIGGDNDTLSAQLQKMAEQGVRKVLINLANVSQIDSSGISTLVRAFISLQHAGGALKLLRPSGHVRQVLNLTRLTGTIPSFDDEAQAIASFQSTAKPAGR